jgi:zinc transport system permease protein
MFESYLINALLAGICVSLIGGALGCFVVWKKMAYFGDSLSHSSLLGIALGIALGINTTIGTFLVCLLFASLLIFLQDKKILSNDTLLGILAHSSLSIGIVSISLLNKKVNLDSYLFGDILTVTPSELIWFFFATLFVLIILYVIWDKLVLVTIDESIAKAERINTSFIPAASARQISSSPLQMGFVSSLIGVLSIILGLFSSVKLDTPTGPTIIVMLVIIFAIIFPLSKKINQT